ncbi:MAG: VWA domain-containing protein, partial [Planctomycetota bacterium]|nr:VWA domain-containing protein [Planctomycetota bacterium]
MLKGLGMFAEIPITFETPGLLLVGSLVLPMVLISRVGAAGQGRAKYVGSLVVRSLLLILLAVALARPMVVDRSDSVTLMVVADMSQSIPRDLQRGSERFLTRVEEAKRNEEDRIGVVTVAEASEIRQTPDPNARIQLDHAGDPAATNLAAAVRTAISLMPTDTANRILLVSDGNETEASVLDSIELASANGIPIDVLPIQYEYDREIVFEGLKAPSRARIGQSIDLRAFIHSSTETAGVLRLSRNGRRVDLDPTSASDGVRIRLRPGTNSIAIPVAVEQAGGQRFRAEFEPDDPESDSLLENNLFEAVTFVSSDGRVLVVSDASAEVDALVDAIRDGGLEVVVEPPSVLTSGTALLNGFDSVILSNIPRWAIDVETDRALRSYVHDLGGGLIMLGGDESFGAGGWIDSETAKALPVRLDPPQERQLTRGALALIMHSCEMPQGNFWGQQTAIAAIEALSSLDYVGIITFNFAAIGQNVNGNSWAYPLQLAGDKQAAIAAAKSMVIGDMPDFAGSMTLAQAGLAAVNAGQRHVIVISDGDPAPPSKALLDKYLDSGITITTIMVGGHGTPSDRMNMQGVAEYTGGTFYNVTNPKALPKIFIKEATLVSRSLIQEGDYSPVVFPSLDGPTRGMTTVPGIDGFVLTVPREGLAKIPLKIPVEDGEDPLLAAWNHGLGRAVAFTSDVGARWAGDWISWEGFQPFWEQVVRWTMRPATPSNLSIRTAIDDEGQAVVEVEALAAEGGFADFLPGEARVLAPDGTSRPVTLQQVGPGRYRTDFAIDQQGAYLVNAIFPSEDGQAAASVQAAVAVPYRREFATTRDNSALLEMIADRTGGRVYDTDVDLEQVDPFEASDLTMPMSQTRIWDIVVVIVASLFVLDVAVRRLSIERRRRRTSGARTGEGAVDAWRQAKKRAGADGGRAEAGDPELAARRVELDEGGGGGFSVGDDLEDQGSDRTEEAARRASRRETS